MTMTFLEQMLGKKRAEEVRLHHRTVFGPNKPGPKPERWTIAFNDLEKGKGGRWDVLFSIRRYHGSKVTELKGIAVLGDEIPLDASDVTETEDETQA